MKTKTLIPQIAQMNADDSFSTFICARLRHLQLEKTDKILREILGKIGR